MKSRVGNSTESARANQGCGMSCGCLAWFFPRERIRTLAEMEGSDQHLCVVVVVDHRSTPAPVPVLFLFPFFSSLNHPPTSTNTPPHITITSPSPAKLTIRLLDVLLFGPFLDCTSFASLVSTTHRKLYSTLLDALFGDHLLCADILLLQHYPPSTLPSQLASSILGHHSSHTTHA